MTRINVVVPTELSRQHLVAEYRELPRIFNLVRKAAERGEAPNLLEIPEYTLGRGHVRFFYPRLTWLANRQDALVAEMLRRGYSPGFTTPMRLVHADIPVGWWGDWSPTDDALSINRARIRERS
ncbi:MAG: endonuclease V [Verrucomicrobiaceae bacterium]|nr:MAG: endonuclease V [Verrucomicrobiaceae bacterium]